MTNEVISSSCIPCVETSPVVLPEKDLCPSPCPPEPVIPKSKISVKIVYTKYYCYTNYVVNMATKKKCNPLILCTEPEEVNLYVNASQ